MDKIYSVYIRDLSKAFAEMLKGSPEELMPYVPRLEELLENNSLVMFGYTVGDLAKMCLDRI